MNKSKLVFLTVILSVAVADIPWDQCCELLSDREPETYTFYQDSGRFVGGSKENDSYIETYGYSGNEEGRNNPDDQCIRNFGVLPAGPYVMDECVNYMHNPPVLRPCSFPLVPQNESLMCGRDEMVVHGCQTTSIGDFTVPPAAGCSLGCVIINFQNRIKLRTGDTLNVEHFDPEGIPQ
ncbi:hypothetical protein PPERSA_03828 [Pseudocohnilembus persalinus]|uniref:Tlde1 domain-containing protein n=1 Tax=Pseudocohnilembus persalinus TaxID=266149 RepID=A0A0V0QU19_PSEPJ|nr:hypothetical protein PPERSA_03828 [Pseudocohnilembus persalinus]|eukprot:KRX05891.1 hypothetical protein PPERSA_03828 [Pseudocohnilembus persalinus]